MKASVQLLTGCVALGLTLPTIQVQAAVPLAGSFATAAAAAGQFGFGRSEARKEADDLLRQARTALKAGDVAKAESLLTKVEKLGVEYDGFSDRFKDNPAKLRKDLAEIKAKGNSSPAKPSSFFPALVGKKDNKNSAPAPVPSSPFASASAQEEALNRMTDDSKGKAKSLAEQGRAALARGDKAGATSFYQKASGYKATFGPGEYSPQQLAADLAKAGVNVSALKPTPNNNAALPFKLSPETLANEAQENLPSLPPSSIGPTRLPAPAVAEASENPSQGSSIYGEPAGGALRLPPAPAGDKNEALRLMGLAQSALANGDLQAASDIAEKAHQMNVPESAFAAGEMRPWQLLLEIQKQATRREGVAQASGEAASNEPKYPVVQGLYNPETDSSRNVAASSGRPIAARAVSATTPGARHYEEGLRALERQDHETALASFTEAWKYQDQLDPATRQQLQDKLTFLRASTQVAPRGAKGSPIEQVQSQQELLRQKLVREIAAEQKEAEKLAATDPNAALANLKKARERVAGSQVEPAAKKQLLTLVDRSIGELTAYIEQNKATIESREHNESVKADIARGRELSLETQNKLAGLVEDFNKLFDEQRYPEAEVVAKQAMEIAPENPLTVNMVEKSALARQIAFNESNRRAKDTAFLGAMNSIEEAARAIDDREPWKIGDVKEWETLSIRRRKGMMEQQRLSPVEQEIYKSLSKQVEVRFVNRPLTEVLATLSKMTGINIHPDETALHSEGITSDTPVTIDLEQPISLRSALNLILGPMRLSYVIRDEVLKVTSEQTRDSDTYNKVYYVADLVVPIPNFVPSYNLGLPGAIREAMSGGPFGALARGAPLTIAANEQQNLSPQVTSPVADTVLAQQVLNLPGMSPGARPTQTMGPGPGGLGGGVIADFDTLIELITTTIEPDSWDEVGGPGTIAEFPTNLSLVISQTQEIHEKISDLLEQLRRLQDLQVTIEVRFITLSDRFFERIGVDFDFNIDDNTGLNSFIDLLTNPPQQRWDDNNHAISIGLGPTGAPTPTLDLQFSQGSFASTRPQFGGFDANTAGQFGFAILSDIEAFFVLEAAQGDDRTNVLQAPKVTLFNGQTAFVSDTSQRPFVISVIPVVGDFAAAHQPVIVVLNEGTSLSVQAVVSADRRFVRVTMVPFFSRIGDVDTFTFVGETTSDSGTSTKDPTDDTKTVKDNALTRTSGTTVQLPTFAFTTVVTTVSVPDGGTVLLGGIKRLREGRNERGIPILAKVPYVSRLFRNVGIGRDAQSLMMMVTPRIIIQEEEEEKLGINLNP